MAITVNLLEFDNYFKFREWNEKRFPVAKMAIKDAFNIEYNYKQHSYKATIDFIKLVIKEEGIKFYGTDDPMEVLNRPTEYIDKDLMGKIFDELGEQLPDISQTSLKIPKLEFNEYGIGNFSFDKASLSMYFVFEFFNKHTGEVYKESNIKKISDDVWVNKETNQPVGIRHKKNERATEKMMERNPNYSFQSPITKETIHYVPKVKTDDKKVYVYFPKRTQVQNEGVDIYLWGGGNKKISASQLMYSSMAGIHLSRILEMAGIPTKIIIIYANQNVKNLNIYGSMFTVKNYNEALDVNSIALMSADPRVVRNERLTSIVSANDEFNSKIDSGNGSTSITAKLELIKYFQKTNKNMNFFFGLTYTMDEVKNDFMKSLHSVERMVKQQQKMVA